MTPHRFLYESMNISDYRMFLTAFHLIHSDEDKKSAIYLGSLAIQKNKPLEFVKTIMLTPADERIKLVTK